MRLDAGSPNRGKGPPVATTNVLAKLIEHNNWANLQIIQACAGLNEEQLDARARPSTQWSIRKALLHLVESQQGYLLLLTQPLESRARTPLAFAELQRSVTASGEGLLGLACDESGGYLKTQIRTADGYIVEPWVVMVQAVNHATDHRRQLSGMLREQGVIPPNLDGWAYGEAVEALRSTST